MGTMRERRPAAWPSEERFRELRARARAIKDESPLARQTELLVRFEQMAVAAGAVVVHAEDEQAACDYITTLAQKRGVRLW